MSALTKINSCAGTFTPNEQAIADYIQSFPREVSEISIQELSHRLGMSTASISRFAKKVGFETYLHLKRDLIRDLTLLRQNDAGEDPVGWDDPEEIVPQKLVHAISQALGDTMQLNEPEALKKAVDLIVGSQRIYCAALGSSVLAARELALRLLRIRKQCLFLEGSNYNLQNLALTGPRDLLVAVSYSGETKYIKSAAGMAKKMGMKVLSITSYSHNALAELSDAILYCPSVANSDARLCSIIRKYTQIFLADLLFIGAARRMAANPESIIEDYINQFFYI